MDDILSVVDDFVKRNGLLYTTYVYAVRLQENGYVHVSLRATGIQGKRKRKHGNGRRSDIMQCTRSDMYTHTRRYSNSKSTIEVYIIKYIKVGQPLTPNFCAMWTAVSPHLTSSTLMCMAASKSEVCSNTGFPSMIMNISRVTSNLINSHVRILEHHCLLVTEDIIRRKWPLS